MNRKGWMLAAGVLLAVLLVALLWLAPWSAPRQRIAGEGVPLPRAEAGAEFIDAAAIEAAHKQAEQAGAKAFIVHRRGHRVLAYFDGADGERLVDGGELAAAVLQLALHQPEDTEGEPAQVAQTVSERIWLPLRAGDAWFHTRTDPPVACCIEARIDDWMRVGDLLNGFGAYLGERVVAADAVRALLAGRAAPATGDEPLLARDGIAFDLSPGMRLWLAPRRGLTMLVWADAQGARDTLLPNLILRGLTDVSPAVGGDISDLVPAH